MTDREPWMPDVGEVDKAVGSYLPADRVVAIRALLRAAVERALAEQELVNSKATEDLIRRCREELSEQEARHKRELECPICCGSVDDSRFRCACGGSNDIRQAFEYLHGEWGRLRSELAQTEARHRREVIEAKLSALADLPEADPAYWSITDTEIAYRISTLRAELAALEEKP